MFQFTLKARVKTIHLLLSRLKTSERTPATPIRARKIEGQLLQHPTIQFAEET